MKSLNQNVLGVINAAISSCNLLANSSLPNSVRDTAASLCSMLGDLTLYIIDQIEIDFTDLPQSNSVH